MGVLFSTLFYSENSRHSERSDILSKSTQLLVESQDWSLGPLDCKVCVLLPCREPSLRSVAVWQSTSEHPPARPDTEMHGAFSFGVEMYLQRELRKADG